MKKRQGELELRVNKEDAPAKQLSSTSTGLTVRNTEAKQPSAQVHISVPTDTIIAFGSSGKNEIWRRGTNKWTKWEKDRDCGQWYACVKAHSTIYIIGGMRGGEMFSPETDIYDISKEEWSKGPRLETRRLELCSKPFQIHSYCILEKQSSRHLVEKKPFDNSSSSDSSYENPLR